MPIFIDESGNTGPILAPRDRHFFLAGVWVPSPDVADAVFADVRAVRRSLGLKDTFEFKFARTGDQPDRRRAFFHAALKHPFRFAVAQLDKQLDRRAGNSALIHWAVAVDLAASFRTLLLNHYPAPPDRVGWQPPKERLWVDDCEDKAFLATLRDKFRELGMRAEPPRQLVGQVQFANSTSSGLLQLADMVCGAYRSLAEDGIEEWYQMIRGRDLNTRPQV